MPKLRYDLKNSNRDLRIISPDFFARLLNIFEVFDTIFPKLYNSLDGYMTDTLQKFEEGSMS